MGRILDLRCHRHGIASAESSRRSRASTVGMTSSWLTNAEWLYAVPFKHFKDFSAADALAVAQEVAEVGYGRL
ncbi:MAG TPA: hypothetical protein VG187_09065 [Mycobacterium sp.]|jgi:hypothetical protein|nr:hypothetical protein [Mycobacterium sp.]